MMNDNELEKIKGYAVKKKEILDSIYDITRSRKFKGEQSEIDEFTEYLNTREPYYNELSELNDVSKGVLDKFELNFDNKNVLYKDVSQILSDVNDVAERIIMLDKENNEKMGTLMESLASDIKKISSLKKARQSYNFFQAQSSTEGH